MHQYGLVGLDFKVCRRLLFARVKSDDDDDYDDDYDDDDDDERKEGSNMLFFPFLSSLILSTTLFFCFSIFSLFCLKEAEQGLINVPF